LGATETRVGREARSALEALILDGIEEGMEKGLKEGMEKGLEKGLEKGMNLALERLCASRTDPAEARRILGLE